jgi:hypothetical protein
MTEETRRLALRVGLVLLAVQPALLAAWIGFAPRSFYDDFPGGGRTWVDNLGPYNEHLLRDFGAANVGFLVLLVAAAGLLDRRVVQVALIAYAAAALPHLAYHVTTAGEYTTSDNILSLSALAGAVLVPLALLVLTREKEDAWRASTQ